MTPGAEAEATLKEERGDFGDHMAEEQTAKAAEIQGETTAPEVEAEATPESTEETPTAPTVEDENGEGGATVAE